MSLLYPDLERSQNQHCSSSSKASNFWAPDFLPFSPPQVTDTPGLLNRPDEDRNAMELLTVASLEYLPTAVLYVTDLTEGCGMSIKEQFAIRKELASRYPAKVREYLTS